MITIKEIVISAFSDFEKQKSEKKVAKKTLTLYPINDILYVLLLKLYRGNFL